MKDVGILVLKRVVPRFAPHGDVMQNTAYFEQLLKEILDRQLGIRNVELNSNLIDKYPDIPTDEVLLDLFEAYGFYSQQPVYEVWDGTLADLARIARANLLRLSERHR